MKYFNKIILTATIALSLSSGVFAQGKEHDKHHAASSPAGAQQSSDSASMTAGEIRKVDKEAGKLTIKHEELKNLEMPAMTMVFRVKDPALLDKVKVGDKVLFVAEKVGGQYTVTQLNEAK